ncbi:4865_t:CDS:2 [Gigaspora rosea]|nr:4865_t:CDS:2 [Gigaspora rosea]
MPASIKALRALNCADTLLNEEKKKAYQIKIVARSDSSLRLTLSGRFPVSFALVASFSAGEEVLPTLSYA